MNRSTGDEPKGAVRAETEKGDELSAAKRRLLEAANPPRPPAGERSAATEGLRLVRQHPLPILGAALVAGLVVAKVRLARVALKAGAVWGGKIAMTRAIRRFQQGR